MTSWGTLAIEFNGDWDDQSGNHSPASSIAITVNSPTDIDIDFSNTDHSDRFPATSGNTYSGTHNATKRAVFVDGTTIKIVADGVDGNGKRQVACTRPLSVPVGEAVPTEQWEAEEG